MFKTIKSILAVATLILSGGALADGHGKVGPYAGMGFGYTTLSSEGPDDKFWSPSVFGGYMPHRNFGIEGGVNWFLLESDILGNVEKITTNSFYLAGIGRYYLTDIFAIYGKGGFHRWKSEGKNGSVTVSENSIDGLFGAGVHFDLSDSTSTRLEYVRYLTDEGAIDGEADIIGIHLLYRF